MSGESVVVAGAGRAVGGVDAGVAVTAAGLARRGQKSVGIDKGKVADGTGQHALVDGTDDRQQIVIGGAFCAETGVGAERAVVVAGLTNHGGVIGVGACGTTAQTKCYVSVAVEGVVGTGAGQTVGGVADPAVGEGAGHTGSLGVVVVLAHGTLVHASVSSGVVGVSHLTGGAVGPRHALGAGRQTGQASTGGSIGVIPGGTGTATGAIQFIERRGTLGAVGQRRTQQTVGGAVDAYIIRGESAVGTAGHTVGAR